MHMMKSQAIKCSTAGMCDSSLSTHKKMFAPQLLHTQTPMGRKKTVIATVGIYFIKEILKCWKDFSQS